MTTPRRPRARAEHSTADPPTATTSAAPSSESSSRSLPSTPSTPSAPSKASEASKASGPVARTGLIPHLLANLRYDLPSSLVVFLVAVPLSLGIAAASGAPLMAGLLSAVVGGVVAGALGGAPLLVTGPAAGLTVVVADLVGRYGWAATAGITAAAGVLQLLLGVTRVGRAALSLSPAVVHGMLAGIGAVIAISQLHIVLGGQPESSVLANLRDLPAQLVGHHDAAALVGAVTIVLLLVWPRLPVVSAVPAPLAAVAAATIVASVFALDLPRVDLPDDLLSGLTRPEMPDGPPTAIALAVFTVAAVASVESLLSAVAVDRMHDGPRAELDRELVAQGAANLAAGALGGLPVTGVIVRSSANVNAGARTRMSTILHGLWIALFVVTLTTLLERIPLSALAAVLVVIGVRLVSLAHMRLLWRHREFAVYVVTFLGVVLTDIMKGVLLGVAVAVLLALYRLTHTTIRAEDHGERGWRIVLRGSLVFLSVGRLVHELRRIPEGAHVLVELHVDFMDHAAFEAFHEWRLGYERRGGVVVVEEVDDTWYDRATTGRPEQRRSLPDLSPRWFAPWSHWQRLYGASAASPPEERVEKPDPMLLGLHQFESRYAPLVRPFLAELAARQRPTQLFLTCADSRVVPNLITSSGPGDLFCVRNIGNLVPREDDGDDSVGAAVEYAVDVLGVTTIVVCGHSDCGAMKAVLGGPPPGAHLTGWLRHAQPSLIRFHDAALCPETGTDGAETPALERLCVANVLQQLDHLRTYPSVRQAVEDGRLSLVGMYFDISSARVFLVDPDTGALAPVQDLAAS
ncbi:carbonic anhydrase [Streptoalloteichus tenebrarius]|uniref:carbonic anhydrase n=1 Tax=Streptoalloteichus tenebrarius (strain ATCC 17920 / DSM 40477 / JCM 4838 / CBS 697.72 / NBRC 16177 / NCIMB 11028 / NRRL B-12390 / A12253. 1 / ISP 5477) TaxID=1933 RepID=A0ABT1I317_STRSD|nr:SulP family inorganic anion transporter [Streptoalloteichus tenebrarius]MCP2262176.1 carbonic anhydrase [Streptoalloteichus tenebrarius]BFF00021.1 SulP family inorganic anion transporter [Streptoalloteichus tenebrarius]